MAEDDLHLDTVGSRAVETAMGSGPSGAVGDGVSPSRCAARATYGWCGGFSRGEGGFHIPIHSGVRAPTAIVKGPMTTKNNQNLRAPT